MKLIILYCATLAVGWAGLSSLFFGLGHWDRNGALMPTLAGALLLLLALRLLLALIRIYFPPKNPRGQGLID